jgi:hypothetical protein
LLQAWGSYRRNNFGKNFWIDKAISSLDFFKEEIIIFTDVRFENEAVELKKLGGVLVRIARPTVLEDKHESEIALDSYPFEHIILNSGTLEHLTQEVRDLAIKLNIRLKY